jgi:hypothetical protein
MASSSTNHRVQGPFAAREAARAQHAITVLAVTDVSGRACPPQRRQYETPDAAGP